MPSRSRLFCLGLSLFVLFVLFLTAFGERGLLHLRRLRQENRTLEERIFILMHDNRELRSRITRLRTDDGFLEKVAREKLGLAKEGEIIYRFHRRTELSEASVSEPSERSLPSKQKAERGTLKPPRAMR